MNTWQDITSTGLEDPIHPVVVDISVLPKALGKPLIQRKNNKVIVTALLVLSLHPAGFLLFKDFCMNEIDEAVPQLKFYEEVSLKCPTCDSVGLDTVVVKMTD